MPTVFDIADAIAERLASIDLTALALLEGQYQGILDRLDIEIVRLEDDIATAQANGQPTRGQWLQRRLAVLKDELQRILTQWADDASTIIELEQERALRNVRDETRILILGSLGDVPMGARLPAVVIPVEALNTLIGFLGDGSPIRGYFDNLADSVSERIIATYLDGMARGLGPKQIGSQVRAITGEPLHRAQTLARTATINAYREAQRRIFEKNASIIRRWRWHSSLDSRTCFPAGTLIETQGGSKPIEDVQVGDKVLTHQGRHQPVSATIKRYYEGDMVEVKAALLSVEATAEHPFLVERKGNLEWICARDLKIGDTVLSIVQGNPHQVQHVISDGCSVKRAGRKTNNRIALSLKYLVFLLVTLYSFHMPIWLINLNHYFYQRQGKINRPTPSLDSVFLNKFKIKQAQAQANIFLWFCFASVTAVASCRAKFSTTFFRRHYTNLLATSQTFNKNWWSATRLRTMFSFHCFFISLTNRLSTTMTRKIFDRGICTSPRTGSPYTSMTTIFCKCFPTTFTGIFKTCFPLSLVLTFQRTMLYIFSPVGRPKLFSALWTKITFSCTRRRSVRVSPMWMFALIQCITTHCTKFATTFADNARPNPEFFSTLKALALNIIYTTFVAVFSTFRATIKRLLSFIISRIDRCDTTTDTTDHWNPSYINGFHKHSILDITIYRNINIVYNLEVETDQSYVANGFVVHNCAICWTMHGTEHSVNEPMPAHWNCRCAMIPITKTWKELGFPGIPDTPQPPTGIELFASLSPEIQQSILGKGKYHRYLMGTLALSDLVGIQDDAIWGSTVYELSLREIDGES